MRLDERVPEPELMDDADQARAYSEGDFAVPHQAFVDAFTKRFPDVATRSARVLDLGCGPADVTVRFALAHPHVEVVGIDGAEEMVELARRRVADAGLTERVQVACRRLPDDELAPHAFDVIVSNSLLHHLADPAVLWRSVRHAGRAGAAVFVGDLRRPFDDVAVDRMVERYAAGEPQVLVADFRASLRAAYRVEEVEEQLDAAGLEGFEVTAVGDRHLAVAGRLGGGATDER